VRDSGDPFGLKVISAVTLRGDMRFSFIEGKMNSAQFIQFLKKLRKDADRPIIVIADNARYHHSKETQKFIEAEADSILMAFLPAYSPELNPDEQVWNHAKARRSKLPVLNAQGMKKCLTSILRSIQKQTSSIKSFFRLTDTKYISESASAGADIYATFNITALAALQLSTEVTDLVFPEGERKGEDSTDESMEHSATDKEKPGSDVTSLAIIALSLLALGGAAVVPGTAYAAPLASAFVRGAENGQGFLLRRLGECYAVTPAHVMRDEIFAALVGTDAQHSRGEADLLQRFGYDLSILHVGGALSDHCGGELGAPADIDRVAGRNALGTVTSVNEDGSITRRVVAVIDVDLINLRVRPRTEADQLFQGLSGSVVTVGDEPVGILMAVDPDNGNGRVLRFDRAVETLRLFFGGTATAAATTTIATPAAPTTGAPDPDNVAAASRGASVVSSSVAPLGGEFRATHLIDAAEPVTLWAGAKPRYPVEIVIDLAGDDLHTLQTMDLIGAGVTPAARLPRDFEILGSISGKGRWRSIVSGTYFEHDQRKEIPLGPVRARRVMLRLYSNWGDADAISLAGIRVLAAE
jgi:transposase